MTGRILRIELRRSAALGTALLLLVTGAALLLSSTQFFAGRWMQLAVIGRSMLMVLLPLALAGGAWMGQRDARYRVNELFASTVRPRWQRVIPSASALAVSVVTAYLLVFLIAAGWVVPTSGYFPSATIAVTAVGVLALIAAGWLGMAAGRAVPRVITAPILAVVGFVLVGLVPEFVTSPAMSTDLTYFRPEPAAVLLVPTFTGLDDFQTVATSVSLLQALWLVSLAATGLLLLGAGRRRAIAFALLPAVLGVAVALPLLPVGGARGAAVVDPVAIELVCDDDGPQVCVTRAHAALLPDVVGPARQALAMMAAKLPNAPARAVETRQVDYWARLDPHTAPARHSPDTIVFETPTIDRGGHADLSGDYFLPSLLEAAWQQECAEQSISGEVYRARMVAAAWLIGRPPAPQSGWHPTEMARLQSAYQALVSLPEAEQQRRMGAAREGALACRDDELVSILPADQP
ncbi:ABC transporter permease [Micromonospora chokoriensis]|uniref:ABC transporter permease n=1 Tax=Micromonospora chokoriensis TaxID=356851 RepID=UPI00068DC001|nr:ABC transporter permease [Micromonospora chokoriensis]